MLRVDVLRHRERPRLPRRAPRHDHRELARKLTPRLHHAAPPAKNRHRLLEIRRRRELHLAFSIVAKIRRLHHARQSHLSDRRRDIPVERLRVGHMGKPVRAQPRLLTLPVLRRVQHVRPRMQRHHRRDPRQRRRRDVFKFIRDDIDPAREFQQRAGILVARVYLAIRHRARRTTGLRLIHVHTIPERLRRLREHAPELPAAQHADRFSRKNHGQKLRVERWALRAASPRSGPVFRLLVCSVSSTLSSQPSPFPPPSRQPRLQHLRRLRRPKFLPRRARARIALRQQRRRKQRRIDRPRLPDGKRRHRHSSRHLHDREQ